MTAKDGWVVERAEGQGGVIRRDQLTAGGVTKSMLARMRCSGLLQPLTADVFVLAGRKPALDGLERAALWQAGSSATLSHGSAGLRWEIPGIRARVPEVLLPWHGPMTRSTVGIVHVSRRISTADVTHLDTWPLTTPARTLVDLAPRLGPRHLTDAITDLLRRHLVDLDTLQHFTDGDLRRRVPGIDRMTSTVRSLAGHLCGDSWLEDRFLAVVDGAGVPVPEVQVWIECGEQRYRVDTLWRSHQLVVELDGHAFHSSRADRRGDAERAARLTLAGFVVLRFTYDDVVDRPAYVVETLQGHLLRRAA